ncbi:MAG TPA: hypothetical protein VD971_12510 [Phycisphaerales bacterium]|nr:hypothetical protein [Phycisphaerales bacterium]
MDFGNIQSTVYQLWQFAWPPLVFAFFVGLLIESEHQRLAGWIRGVTIGWLGSDPQKNVVRRFLTSIGAGKLYPAVLGVMLVLLFVLMNEWIRFWQWVPPTMVTIPGNFRLGMIGPSDRVALYTAYPDAYSLGDAWSMATQEHPSDAPLGERYSFYHQLQLVCKASAVSALLLLPAVFWSSTTRFRAFAMTTGIVCLTMLIWFVCLVPMVRERQHTLYQERQDVLAAVRELARKETTQTKFDDLPERFRDSGPDRAWWGVRMRLSESARWFRDDFAPGLIESWR